MDFLIIKTSSLGDIVQSFPVIDYLRAHYENVCLDWVVEESFAPLLHSYKGIDRIMTINTKKWRGAFFKHLPEMRLTIKELRTKKYDIIFDLQGNVKSSAILACSRGKKKVGFGAKSVPEWPNLLFTHTKINPPQGRNIRDDYLSLVQRGLAPLTPHLPPPPTTSPFSVLVFPCAAWSNKELPLHTLLEVLQTLHNKYPLFFLFAYGKPAEKEKALYLHHHFPHSSLIDPPMQLPDLKLLIKQSHLVLAMDSLPLHLSALTTPTFSFFGPSNAHKYAPPSHTYIQGPCPYGLTFPKRCPHLRTCPTAACIKTLNPQHILQHLLPLIDALYHNSLPLPVPLPLPG